MTENPKDSCTQVSGIRRGRCSSTAAIIGGIGEGGSEPEVPSAEDLHLIPRQLRQQVTHRCSDQFEGLTAEQMYRFIYFPFDTPELVTFPPLLDETPEAPMLTLFMLIAEAIGQGVKPTATGNLPRRLCQEVAQAYLGEEEYRSLTCIGELRSELELTDLHTTRMVAEMAGLIRRYKGRFIVGRECRKAMAEQGKGWIYPRLFRTFAGDFNWGYGDSWAERPSIQQSFLFSLFLLKKNGQEWRANMFYEDSFLRAFPAVVQEARPPAGGSAEEVVRRCYSARCLKTFAHPLGLVEIAHVEWDFSGFQLRKLPLLDRAVHFHLPGILEERPRGVDQKGGG